MTEINIIALIVGYAVIISAILKISSIVFLILARFIKDKFYKTRLWWEIHTIKVFCMNLSKMHNDPYALIIHKELLSKECPKDLLSVWVNKIDQKLDEIREGILLHGETPTF